MGLEMVELVMEVEERFGVRLPEIDAYGMRTLGDLHEVLVQQSGRRKRPDCPTRTVFYRLRGALGHVLGIEAHELRPSTAVLPLLGTWRRGRTWRRVQRRLEWKLPPLEGRAGQGVALGWVGSSAGAFLAVTVLSGDLCTAAGAGLVAMLPGVLLGYIVGVLWIPTLPSPLRTAGDVARAVVALNRGEFHTGRETPSADDPVWNQLCDIVAEQFRVRPESLHADTRFVEDLGC